MLRKGYLERQMEGLAEVIAKVLRLKESNDYGGALTEVRLACKKLSGMDIDTMIALPDETLLSLFTSGYGGQGVARCFVAAALLRAQADLHEHEGRADAARRGYEKALLLFLESLLREEDLRTDQYRAHIEGLKTKLSDSDLPATVQYRLFCYHELLGDFGHAEDALYALREADYPDAAAEAAAFYRRLLEKPDAELIAGGLPRDEVKEGLADVEANP